MAVTTHPPSSAEVEETVELYIWAFVACFRVNFTFYIFHRLKENENSLLMKIFRTQVGK